MARSRGLASRSVVKAPEPPRTTRELLVELAAEVFATEGYASPELERSSGRAEALCRHRDAPLPVRFGLWSVRLMRGSPDQPELFLGWFAQAIERGAPI